MASDPVVRVVPCPYNCGAIVVQKLRAGRFEAANLDRTRGRPYIVQRHACNALKQPFLTFELLGMDLNQMKQARGGRLDSPTVAAIGAHCLAILRELHAMSYVHRDIKPHNIMLRRSSMTDADIRAAPHLAGDLVLIDMELMKRFQFTDGHVPESRDGLPQGTPRYMDVWSHEGRGQSRRSDIMALLFTLAHLRLGTLPWQGRARDEKGVCDHRELIRFKLKWIEETTHESSLIKVIVKMLKACLAMGFRDKPDYDKWIEILSRFVTHAPAPVVGLSQSTTATTTTTLKFDKK